ncbi:type 11 methyltransferase [Ligilactobacillus pabuli]|uniref:Type 11 methyltransferase n=1 Tax=Ligilactobacillus pabuli TaxID=2886039 RepID=A0ABQ5JIH6_9LACO|nr:class I SAM-dependent methyltransferase [Ligilactobacillus pabuli]GKS81077.1 type 11 methyltransferase [Ligilactobacillus pabuli]
MKKINRGIDAPLVPLIFILASLMALFFWITYRAYPFAWLNSLFAIAMLAGAVIFLHTSLRGKYQIWEQLTSELTIPKDAKILDLGCGHGLNLIKFAQLISPTGKVVGVDLWRSVDQSKNSRAATVKNLIAANVQQKVSLKTADMADLPFGDETFNFVISSLAFHNIKPAAKRQRALQEAIRVLQPGGQLLLVDTGHYFKQYQAVLAAHNLTNIQLTSAGVNGWWTGPWMRTMILTAQKAA